MEKSEAVKLFAKASKLDRSKLGYMPEVTWDSIIQLDGAKTFKRKAIGLFRTRTDKTLEEIAQLLCQTGIVSSREEGIRLTPNLVGTRVPYGHSSAFEFVEVRNFRGEIKYRIHAYLLDLGL